MNFLVETKTEYTTQLVNIIAPFLYEGFKTIYDDAIKVAKQNEELKVFQTFLRKIPFWNDDIYNAELNRIKKDSEYGDILEDLVRAVIKSNIMLLTNTPPEKKNKLKINFVIELNKFIHYSYIESAKSIFQNPYLFFHKYSQLELKRNQKESLEVIKTSINEAIRKMLPINIILKEYLGQSFTETQLSEVEKIDKTLSDVDKTRVLHLLKANQFNDNDISYNLVKKNNATVDLNNKSKDLDKDMENIEMEKREKEKREKEKEKEKEKRERDKRELEMEKEKRERDKREMEMEKKEREKREKREREMEMEKNKNNDSNLKMSNDTIVLDKKIDINDSDKSNSDMIKSLEKKTNEKKKLPESFRKKIDYPSITSNVSESYMPKNAKIEVFESYTMGSKNKSLMMDTIKLIQNETNDNNENNNSYEMGRNVKNIKNNYTNKEFNI
jgi:hypothetical protein